MAKKIQLPCFSDERGNLTVIEDAIDFEIKRIYYIYNARSQRGGHRHKKAIQALVSVSGSCEIYINDGKEEEWVVLDNPNECLILDPKDWHTMDKFSEDSILLVISSEKYDIDDYIDEKY